MPHYEIPFVVASLTERVIERLYDQDIDCFAATDFDERHIVTVVCPGTNAVDAAKSMLTRLQEFGLIVHFIQHDLVNRSEIANRLGVTRMAVSNWVRGERLSVAFPPAFSDAAGGIWLWGDVVRWRRTTSKQPIDPGVDYPTRADLDCLNDYIRSGCLSDEDRHQRTVAEIQIPPTESDVDFFDLANGHSVSVRQPVVQVRKR